MTEITSRIHWLSFTVHGYDDDPFLVYQILFQELFGPLQALGHGGRGFKEIHKNQLEFKIYSDPVGDKKNYYHYEIPGRACDCIDIDRFFALGELLKGNYQNYKFARLDFAFDHVPFEPIQVKDAIMKDQVRSLAKRESLHIHESPYQLQDSGEYGTCTVDFGSRTSGRMIRVYNKRGFTRLEMESKDDRADLIAKELLGKKDGDKCFKAAQSHLLDYVDFNTDWWKEFINSNIRAGATVSNPKEISTMRLMSYLKNQVSPSLSVAIDALPHEDVLLMIDHGRKHRGKKYDLILAGADHPTRFDGSGHRAVTGSHQNGGDEE